MEKKTQNFTYIRKDGKILKDHEGWIEKINADASKLIEEVKKKTSSKETSKKNESPTRKAETYDYSQMEEIKNMIYESFEKGPLKRKRKFCSESSEVDLLRRKIETEADNKLNVDEVMEITQSYTKETCEKNDIQQVKGKRFREAQSKSKTGTKGYVVGKTGTKADLFGRRLKLETKIRLHGEAHRELTLSYLRKKRNRDYDNGNCSHGDETQYKAKSQGAFRRKAGVVVNVLGHKIYADVDTRLQGDAKRELTYSYHRKKIKKDDDKDNMFHQERNQHKAGIQFDASGKAGVRANIFSNNIEAVANAKLHARANRNVTHTYQRETKNVNDLNGNKCQTNLTKRHTKAEGNTEMHIQGDIKMFGHELKGTAGGSSHGMIQGTIKHNNIHLEGLVGNKKVANHTRHEIITEGMAEGRAKCSVAASCGKHLFNMNADIEGSAKGKVAFCEAKGNYEKKPENSKRNFKAAQLKAAGKFSIEGSANINGKRKNFQGKADGKVDCSVLKTQSDLELKNENDGFSVNGIKAEVGHLHLKGKADMLLNGKKIRDISGEVNMNVLSAKVNRLNVRKAEHSEAADISIKGGQASVAAFNANVVGKRTGKRSTVSRDSTAAKIKIGNFSATGIDERKPSKVSARLKTGAQANILNAEIQGLGPGGINCDLDPGRGINILNFKAGINRQTGLSKSSNKLSFLNVNLSLGCPRLPSNPGRGAFNIGIPFMGGGGGGGDSSDSRNKDGAVDNGGDGGGGGGGDISDSTNNDGVGGNGGDCGYEDNGCYISGDSDGVVVGKGGGNGGGEGCNGYIGGDNAEIVVDRGVVDGAGDDNGGDESNGGERQSIWGYTGGDDDYVVGDAGSGDGCGGESNGGYIGGDGDGIVSDGGDWYEGGGDSSGNESIFGYIGGDGDDVISNRDDWDEGGGVGSGGEIKGGYIGDDGNGVVGDRGDLDEDGGDGSCDKSNGSYISGDGDGVVGNESDWDEGGSDGNGGKSNDGYIGSDDDGVVGDRGDVDEGGGDGSGGSGGSGGASYGGYIIGDGDGVVGNESDWDEGGGGWNNADRSSSSECEDASYNGGDMGGEAGGEGGDGYNGGDGYGVVSGGGVGALDNSNSSSGVDKGTGCNGYGDGYIGYIGGNDSSVVAGKGFSSGDCKGAGGNVCDVGFEGSGGYIGGHVDCVDGDCGGGVGGSEEDDEGVYGDRAVGDKGGDDGNMNSGNRRDGCADGNDNFAQNDDIGKDYLPFDPENSASYNMHMAKIVEQKLAQFKTSKPEGSRSRNNNPANNQNLMRYWSDADKVKGDLLEKYIPTKHDLKSTLGPDDQRPLKNSKTARKTQPPPKPFGEKKNIHTIFTVNGSDSKDIKYIGKNVACFADKD